jgi:hypothetical protein
MFPSSKKRTHDPEELDDEAFNNELVEEGIPINQVIQPNPEEEKDWEDDDVNSEDLF